MTDHRASAETNPFCSRFVRPGVLPFIFPEGESAAAVVERLAQNGWRGEILGPHGSGKSALMAALIPAFEDAGRAVVHVELHDGQKTLPARFYRRLGATPQTVVTVDGCEQLSWWQRRKLFGFVRRAGAGVVATAHRTVGLPELVVMRPTAELAVRLVAQLQLGRALVSEDEVCQAFADQGGNLREMLFALYDLYQFRQHTGKT